jgi:hypothetical protein
VSSRRGRPLAWREAESERTAKSNDLYIVGLRLLFIGLLEDGATVEKGEGDSCPVVDQERDLTIIEIGRFSSEQ